MPKNAQKIPGQYIVVYKDQWNGRTSTEAGRQAQLFVNERISELGIDEKVIKHRYQYVLRGFAATLSPTQLKVLRNDPRVDYIEQDQTFKAFASATPSVSAVSYSGQATSWGISRLNGPLNGAEKKAWVIDSGIDLDHPDLNVDVANSASFIAEENADDILGHGTHVSGIIAAKNNSIDVVGMAAGASVVAVKVIAQNDSGAVSDVVAGVNYVASLASSTDIINMSIGGPQSSSIDNSVINAANTGLRFTVSAGNSNANANNYSPARVEHANVWTVSAFKQGDIFATSFSNYGNPPIDYSGPGVNIPSLYKNGGTATLSGTSMAAPHIAGLLLTAPNDIAIDGYVSNDPDGNPDPIAAYTPFQVYITGPTIRDSGESGTWTAHPQYGSGNYSYQWYFKNIGQASWIAAGTSQSYSRSFDNQGTSPGTAQLKVKVNSGSEQAENTHYIIINGAGCPPGQICL